MPRYEDLPYRPCAGLCVINRKGLVFIGRRIDGPEHVDETHVWQMPQGGIDEGEKPYPAALRELYEETNIKSVEKLGEIRAGSPTTSRKDRRQGVERQISRPDAEMVRAALHRQGQRDRHREPRRRARAGVRRLALGADGEPSRPGGAVQAQDLRAGGEGVFEIRQVTEFVITGLVPADRSRKARSCAQESRCAGTSPAMTRMCSVSADAAISASPCRACAASSALKWSSRAIALSRAEPSGASATSSSSSSIWPASTARSTSSTRRREIRQHGQAVRTDLGEAAEHHELASARRQR